MDQQKIGRFLKQLRNEKNLTQEELAEKLNVSGRTVSRWETGANMPDISLLVEIAEFYDVSIPEIIDGERKSENMNEEVKETGIKMAEYAEKEKELLTKRVCIISVIGFVSLLTALVFTSFCLGEISPVLSCIEGIGYGVAIGALLTSIFYGTGVLARMHGNKRARIVSKSIGVAGAIVIVVALILAAVVSR